MPHAAALMEMTPREVELELTAFAAREKARRLETWLLGRYVAIAVHDPSRYPPPPFGISPASMTDDEMKQRLLAMRGKDEHNDP